MMEKLAAWFRSKNITAHTIAVLAVSAAGLITGDQQVRDFLIELFKAHPVMATDIIMAATILAKYSHSSSAAGTLATARVINDSPDAPTAAAVDAASTK